MNLFYVALAIVLALPAQWFLSGFKNYWMPPVLLMAVILSFWHLRVSQRFWLGLILGVLLDTVSIFPFGSHLLILSLAVVLTEGGRTILSNTDSVFTQSLSAAIILFISLFLLYPLGYVINYFSGAASFWPGASFLKIMLYTVIWSLSLPLVACAYEWLQGKKKRKRSR